MLIEPTHQLVRTSVPDLPHAQYEIARAGHGKRAPEAQHPFTRRDLPDARLARRQYDQQRPVEIESDDVLGREDAGFRVWRQRLAAKKTVGAGEGEQRAEERIVPRTVQAREWTDRRSG